MKTPWMTGRLIIRVSCLLLILFQLFIVGCSSDTAIKKKVKNECLTFYSEQAFWDEWINKNDNVRFPLDPLITRYTQPGLHAFHEIITDNYDQNSCALFVQVSIDNGLFDYMFLTWDIFDDYMDVVEWAGPMSEIVRYKVQKGDNDILDKIKLINMIGVVVDIKNEMLLDGNGIYLSVNSSGKISRYAVYGEKKYSGQNRLSDFLGDLVVLSK